MSQRRNFLQQIVRLWGFLQPRRQSQFFFLLVFMLFASISEMVSIGAVLPFISVLVTPEKIFNNANLHPLINFFSINSPQGLLLPITLIFCVAAILTGLFRLLLLYSISRFSFSVGADFSLHAYRSTLYQPYLVHIGRNSSEIINGITGKVAMLIGSILMPILTLLSSMILLIGVIVILLLINPQIAISASLGFGALYIFTALISRRRLRENSECIAIESNKVIKALQEGLGGIRDILIDGTQETYSTIYRNADLSLRRAQAQNAFSSVSPRYIMEMLGMITIAIIAYSMAISEGGLYSALPVLGALAVGAQRLLPVLQQGYYAIATILGAEASMRDGLNLLEQTIPIQAKNDSFLPINFVHSIRLRNISFRYPLNDAWVIKNIDLEILKGSRVGIVGSTGSGKSTLLDIVMSLLPPSEGSLEIDEHFIDTHNYRNWQTHIAHVPQNIYLSDSSVEENIAFGINKKEIDTDRVYLAAKQAQLHDLIESWPKKYQTLVGERGIRLSGGQRQRIGIARALYKKADVIIFDEATSALDNKTERLLIETIDSLSTDLTIIIVAHRLTTLQNCDFIIELDMGRVSRISSYKDLINE
jgi:ATP-binding cassette subfamily B protein